MRRIPLLLALSTLSTGCVDALGIGSTCTFEMAQVRSEHGPPDSDQTSEVRGNHTVVWYYDDSHRKYEFRWGTGYDECQMTVGSFTLLPEFEELRH